MGCDPAHDPVDRDPTATLGFFDSFRVPHPVVCQRIFREHLIPTPSRSIAHIGDRCHGHAMLSIGLLLLIGFVTGVVVGLPLGSNRFGCWTLAFVPIGAIGYVSWWQSQHIENLRSTSGLEFIFVPIPPSIAALVGYGLVRLIRNWRISRD